MEYTFFFICPLLTQALHNVPFEFKLGESHLKCAVKNADGDKAADSGPKIGIITYHKRLELAIGVVEVSGRKYKVNKNHYLGDRKNVEKIHLEGPVALRAAARLSNIASILQVFRSTS